MKAPGDIVKKTNDDGTYYYKENEKGQLVYHRVDGPAVEFESGTKQWYLNGKLHREDGPAIEWEDGDKEWWLFGKRHRINGPAVEMEDGTKEWYIDDEKYSEENFERERQRIYKNLLLTNYAMTKSGITHPEPFNRIQYYSTR